MARLGFYLLKFDSKTYSNWCYSFGAMITDLLPHSGIFNPQTWLTPNKWYYGHSYQLLTMMFTCDCNLSYEIHRRIKLYVVIKCIIITPRSA